MLDKTKVVHRYTRFGFSILPQDLLIHLYVIRFLGVYIQLFLDNF